MSTLEVLVCKLKISITFLSVIDYVPPGPWLDKVGLQVLPFAGGGEILVYNWNDSLIGINLV
jgi:hypothetical protein